MYHDYIVLDDKKYKVVDNPQYQPTYGRQKTYTVGLTGKTIGQDFTVSDRTPLTWQMTLRVFISERPDSSWGLWSDLLSAFNQLYVSFTEHNDEITHEVGITGNIIQVPRVGANIEGHCYGIFYVSVVLLKRQT